MHSHSSLGALLFLPFLVLILVVMEDALAHDMIKRETLYGSKVLILVVMEDALAQILA